MRMKKLTKKFIFIPALLIFAFAFLLFIADVFIMPMVVTSPEVTVPDVIGKNKTDAAKSLVEKNLVPVEQGPIFDERFSKDEILKQKPSAGTVVKEGRRIYIFVSGGEALIKMPSLIQKTFRDARVTIENLNLTLGSIEDVNSEWPTNTVIEQSPPEGTNVAKGTEVQIKISIGPSLGKIRVPNLLGMSLKDGENLLKKHSLIIGKINYERSPNLLPNTIIDQYPSQDELLSVGESVDVFVTKSGS